MNRKNIQIAGSVLLIILIVLIFFSRTIYTSGMPTVTAVSPTHGKLTKSETITGTVNWATTKELYSELTGKVEEILVNEGDSVTEGQILFKMHYEIDDVKQKLEEINVSKTKLSIEIEKLKLQQTKNVAAVAELKAEVYKKDEVSDYDIVKSDNQLHKALSDYKYAREQYDNGEITDKQMDDARTAYFSVELDNDHLHDVMEQNEEKAVQALAEKEKAREKQLAEYEYSAEVLRKDLQSKQLDASNYDLQQKNYEKQLANFEEYAEIKAVSPATVISIPVKEGQNVNANMLMITYGKDLRVQGTVSSDNNFTVVGDSCTLSNSSYSYDGIVASLTPSQTGKDVVITVQDGDFTAGETLEVELEKESISSGTLLPNAAIHKDSDGYFVYVLKKRDSYIGKEHYIEKSSVTCGDSDSSKTIITQGLGRFDVIVTLSDKQIMEGLAVKLKNEGDFLAS